MPETSNERSGAAALRTDTGLHIVMRSLLAIIAGLLVADAVKACVTALTLGAISVTITRINAAIAIAGTVFVARVVADNFLYYAAPDVVTEADDYIPRVVLIGLDLFSYAACYGVVMRITTSREVPVVTTGAVRWAVTYAALVELSHALWCLIARLCFDIATTSDGSMRVSWLRRWFAVSGASSLVLGGIAGWAWRAFRPGFATASPSVALAALGVSFLSTIVYLYVMRKDYGRRRML